jgi:hypothetical protein
MMRMMRWRMVKYKIEHGIFFKVLVGDLMAVFGNREFGWHSDGVLSGSFFLLYSSYCVIEQQLGEETKQDIMTDY